MTVKIALEEYEFHDIIMQNLGLSASIPFFNQTPLYHIHNHNDMSHLN